MKQSLRILPLSLAALATAVAFSTAAPASAQSFSTAHAEYGAELIDAGFKVKIKKKHFSRSYGHRSHRYHGGHHRASRHDDFGRHHGVSSRRSHGGHKSHHKHDKLKKKLIIKKLF